jgi:hypothetical protein
MIYNGVYDFLGRYLIIQENTGNLMSIYDALENYVNSYESRRGSLHF